MYYRQIKIHVYREKISNAAGIFPTGCQEIPDKYIKCPSNNSWEGIFKPMTWLIRVFGAQEVFFERITHQRRAVRKM